MRKEYTAVEGEAIIVSGCTVLKRDHSRSLAVKRLAMEI